MVFNVGERRTVDTMRPLHELLGAGLDRIEELEPARLGLITGVATGYHELDRILLGFQPSSLNIVGARPGMRKTSFALGVLANVGLRSRRPALLFSLEMGHLELTQRLLASEAEVNRQSLQTGRIRTQDWSKIGMAVTRRVSGAPIFIDDNPNVTVMDIRARARRPGEEVEKLTSGIVVVDYLQLMMTGPGPGREPPDRGGRDQPRPQDPRTRARGACRRTVTQLSPRTSNHARTRRPQLSDLRESGVAGAGRGRRALHLPRVRVQRRGPDRPGRRRADRSGQAPKRADRQGQPAVLEAVRPLAREPPRRHRADCCAGSSPALRRRSSRQHEECSTA